MIIIIIINIIKKNHVKKIELIQKIFTVIIITTTFTNVNCEQYLYLRVLKQTRHICLFRDSFDR